MQEDALVLVQLRNHFYKKKYYLALIAYLLSLLVVGILVCALVYLIRNPTHPLYFVTDRLGRLIQDLPLDTPNMPTNDVAAWAIDAVEGAYSYDHVNYRAELQSVQKYFSDYGWRNYMSSLTASNNLLALTQRKMIIIAKVVSQPKLVTEGLLGGAYAWKFELPVLVTYLTPPYDEKSRFQNPLIVTVVVQRKSILTSYKGLAIIQMIGSIVLTQPVQNMTQPA